MTASIAQATFATSPNTDNSRLDYLDATRAFALVLGIVFHACLSFMPIFMGWAVQDISTSPLVAIFMTVFMAVKLQSGYGKSLTPSDRPSEFILTEHAIGDM